VAAPLALIFGEVLLGGLLIDHGAKDVKAALPGGSSSSSAAGTGSSTASVATETSSAPAETESETAWAKQLLASIDAPDTQSNIAALYDWAAREGPFDTQAAYNPLNVSGPLVGTGKFDGTPAENYANAAAGIQGEDAYFGQYGEAVVKAFQENAGVSSIEAAVRSLGPNAFGTDTDTPWAS
jgi:peptidoglycan hydrolase-like protein with peptidoglycan-binding domain